VSVTLKDEFAAACKQPDFRKLKRSPEALHRVLATRQGRWGLAEVVLMPGGTWRPAETCRAVLKRRRMILIPVYEHREGEPLVDLIATTLKAPSLWLSRTLGRAEMDYTPLEYLVRGIKLFVS